MDEKQKNSIFHSKDFHDNSVEKFIKLHEYSWSKEGKKILSDKRLTLNKQEKRILKYLILQKNHHEYRPELWLKSSGAKLEMRNNVGYYHCLINEFPPDIPNHFENQIELDLKRTFPTDPFFSEPCQIDSMRRILTSFSKRNNSIGYCQGFNFIVAKLIKVFANEEDREEKVFWIFCQIIEFILPLNYYSEMAGILIDQKILERLVFLYNENVYRKFEKVGLMLETITIQWLVSIFSQNIDEKILLLVWDLIFIDGSIVLFKTALGLIDILKSSILEQNSMEDMYSFFEKSMKKIQNENTILYYSMLKVYDFDFEFIKKIRNEIENEITHKLNYLNNKSLEYMEKSEFKIKRSNIVLACDRIWPICLQKKEKNKKIIEVFIYKSNQETELIEDYLELQNKKGKFVHIQFPVYNTILIERKNHYCDNFRSNRRKNSKSSYSVDSCKSTDQNNLSVDDDTQDKISTSTHIQEIKMLDLNHMFKRIESKFKIGGNNDEIDITSYDNS